MTFLPDDATGDALRRMIAGGSDLSEPMEIDFFVAIPHESAGNKVAEKAREVYETRLRDDLEKVHHGEFVCI